MKFWQTKIKKKWRQFVAKCSLLLDVINFSLDAKHWQQQWDDRSVSNLGMFQRVIYLHIMVVDIFCTACIVSVIIYLLQFTAIIIHEWWWLVKHDAEMTLRSKLLKWSFPTLWTTTIILRPFVRDYPGELVPEETLTHPPSWSSSNLCQLLPSTTIHSILFVQITCLTN